MSEYNINIPYRITLEFDEKEKEKEEALKIQDSTF
jgi:hypothetical protein